MCIYIYILSQQSILVEVNGNGSESAVFRPEALSNGNLLMQSMGLQPGPTKSEILGMNTAIYLIKPPVNSDANSSLKDMFIINKKEKNLSHFTCWVCLAEKFSRLPHKFPTAFSHPPMKHVECLFYAG